MSSQITGHEISTTTYNELSDLSQEQLQKLLNHIQYEKLKDKMSVEVTKTEMDTNAVIDRFLNSLNDQTSNTYRPYIKSFQEEVTHLLDVDTEFVDDYIIRLSKKYAAATVHLRVAALSGLYSRMVRWGYASINPFKDCKLPSKKRARELRVPSEAEVAQIIDFYYNKATESHTLRDLRSGNRMYVACTLMAELGIRVGAISDLTVQDGRYTCVSKGKKISGDFTLPIDMFSELGYDMQSEKPFKEITKPMVQFNLYKLKEDIGIDVHAHSFRHYAAVREYSNSKDIYHVSRFLNHNSVGITERYLESIRESGT